MGLAQWYCRSKLLHLRGERPRLRLRRTSSDRGKLLHLYPVPASNAAAVQCGHGQSCGRSRSRFAFVLIAVTKMFRPFSLQAIASALLFASSISCAKETECRPQVVSEAPVFPGNDGKPRSKPGVRFPFKQAASRAGLPPQLRFHDLRHNTECSTIPSSG